MLHFRLFFRIEVIKIAKELVESMIGGPHMVEIAQMVLTEMSCSITLFLQQCGDRYDLFTHPDRCARYAYFGQAGAVNALPGNEGRASCCTGLFAIRVCKHHAFFCNTVNVGCLVTHQSVRITTEIGYSNVITPDDKNIRLFLFRLCHFVDCFFLLL